MQLDFSKLGNGLIPAIVQDSQTSVVLMLGFMNEEAFEKTQKEGKVTFYSRSKDRLWTKGEESGNFLNVVSITPDCDSDTILIKANPVGPVCHTGSDTCFNESNLGNAEFLIHLQDLIDKRLQDMPEGSYTTSLFNKGINKIAQKVGEEAVETVIEAKDSNEELFLNEVADLTYHTLVLLTAKGHRIEDVIKVLQGRHK
ncbi:bifunctional phosphoribosyl-AMP cyclohydrolase/phosphoribosyl-ATP diphosphatase HisIE [Marinilabilia rubra]|uniref:Histidine biosynthesis bifunctional protein HisIE n=1 Tax=Marinilabilia rubra TaxID=2162893 RepID=A0A2U2BDU0_9BACT|nr:bifunctional phosphoribosyl-AMP cyclohydrolase/phosphoribosyl-ATP diphosphatase HisIE [Marinilabilia rubra]PWE01234.1 bifunctional phosphoribosyl-AMP cyclohydrolase/phosphoribosyl-ATP diphosphatase [Marinilabilia rubra]